MGFYADKAKDFEPVSPGIHPAICYYVVDLGTQETTFKNKKRIVHQGRIGWEVQDEITREEKPKVIFQKFNITTSKNGNLRKALNAWRGKELSDEEMEKFDLEKLIGTQCQIIVESSAGADGNTYYNVTKVVKHPEWPKKKTPFAPTVYYSINDHGGDIPDNISDKIKEVIMASEEWQQINGDGIDERNRAMGEDAGDPGHQDEDAIPF